jgi:uncharacterized membrane protein YidH (DUF202 family)
MELIGFTLEILGKILIAYTALRVHFRFRKEHKIDSKVFNTMRREQIVGIIGITLIILGYIIQIPFKL